ncbi:unnamed protein product (macronuclear) [Paramecium tetraurelia]|uniref:F-box domain-containing protein n=1 Tax=Paramecium tetraurelia TaxID=5888 RepID=A0EFH2_PARTE|nr:uncharacterized protein GSPATT00026386001 [Paramecium tetraurelia]CAK94063.1 unnamed protein product [Paramecium tetraurelia]|eukprot:XP_001461436.1 hypothetical protein (macronuclear) [Paramecium tetraurelia strain d4-2]
MNAQLELTMLNENRNQQKAKITQLFIELQQLQQKYLLISGKNIQAQNSTLSQNQNLIVQYKKTGNLFSKFRTEIIVQFTMYLNVKQILQLRKVNKLFNLIICSSLPTRIIQYQTLLENIQNSFKNIPTTINKIPDDYQMEQNALIDWEEVWSFKEINKIYGSKELEPEIFQVFKFMYISIYPDFPEDINLDKIKKMLTRESLRYDLPEWSRILTEKQISALQDVMLLDAQKINAQYKFSGYVCLYLQRYVKYTKTDSFKFLVQSSELRKREKQIQERLQILNKLNKKINK